MSLAARFQQSTSTDTPHSRDTSETKERRQYESPAAAFSRYVCLCRFCERSSPEISEDGDTEENVVWDSDSELVLSNDEFETDDEGIGAADRMGDQTSKGREANLKLTENEEEGECRIILRLKLHIKDVTTVLLDCPEIATLRVGMSNKTLTCHKALLGLHSEFFDAALYGNFLEGQSGTLDLPEESPEEIAAFLSWMYSGTIESELNAAQLWLLGDRLRIPAYCNDVMYLLMNTYGSTVADGGQWLSASTVDYVYAHTNEHSLLRCFVRDVLRGEGPLCERALEAHGVDERDHYRTEWNELIYRGGDLVMDIATVSSFSADKSIDQYGVDIDHREAPYLSANQHKYLVDSKGLRPVEDFVNRVRR